MEEEKKANQESSNQKASVDVPKPPQTKKPGLTPSVDVNIKDKEVKTGWKNTTTSGDTKVEVEGGNKLFYGKDAEISGYGSIKGTTQVSPKTEIVGSTAFDSGKEQVKFEGQATQKVASDIKVGISEKFNVDQNKGTISDNTNLNANWQIDKNTKAAGSAGYSFINREADFKLEAEHKFKAWTVKNSAGLKVNGKGNTFEDTLEGKYKPNKVWDFAGKIKYTNPPGPEETLTTTQTANVNLVNSSNKNFNMAIEHIYDLKKGQTTEISGKANYKIQDMEAFIKGGAVRNGTTNKLDPSIGIGVVKHF